MPDQELDVRGLRKPDKHPAIFRTYDALAVGESFVLINNHDPRHLHDEFDTDHPGGYGWEYLDKGPQLWRIRISKLASTPLPRILCDTATVAASEDPDAAGAIWKLPMSERDLDSNIVALPAGGTIDAHAGPDLDVLVVVLAGSGQLGTELDTLDLRPGALVWLPRRSRRRFVAGPDGLRYLTVHQRRRALVLGATVGGSEAAG
ncbi:DUF2249 domain-containing protein [Plantactinospora veratri]|uniref:DUF2249 domain-containing protein n=1 Tax=Plantactinospora veratri TaxID=1436122 RepID=A0ABU7SJU6_9ACTN